MRFEGRRSVIVVNEIEQRFEQILVFGGLGLQLPGDGRAQHAHSLAGLVLVKVETPRHLREQRAVLGRLQHRHQAHGLSHSGVPLRRTIL